MAKTPAASFGHKYPAPSSPRSAPIDKIEHRFLGANHPQINHDSGQIRSKRTFQSPKLAIRPFRQLLNQRALCPQISKTQHLAAKPRVKPHTFAEIPHNTPENTALTLRTPSLGVQLRIPIQKIHPAFVQEIRREFPPHIQQFPSHRLARRFA